MDGVLNNTIHCRVLWKGDKRSYCANSAWRGYCLLERISCYVKSCCAISQAGAVVAPINGEH